MKAAEAGALVVGVAVLGVAYYVWRKGGVGNAVAEAAAGAVGAASDAAGGLVQGVSSSFGVPRTNQTECERAIAEGRTWDASFACPAGTFITSVWDAALGNGPQDPNQSAAETARLMRYARPAYEADPFDQSGDPYSGAGSWG